MVSNGIEVDNGLPARDRGQRSEGFVCDVGLVSSRRASAKLVGSCSSRLKWEGK
jgi:hypothetical protein